MTRAGFGFIIAGLAVYLIANQTQVGWLYLMDAFIWSLLAISASLSRFNLNAMNIEQQAIFSPSGINRPPLKGPFEGETAEVKLKVNNGARFARYFIRLQVDCPFEEPEIQLKNFLIGAIKPGATLYFSYTGTCYKRGRYSTSTVTLQYGDPLGLIIRHRVIRLPLNLTVYPEYFPVDIQNIPGEGWVDRGQGIKSDAGTEFHGSREYQYGDPLKHIHWRNTAKTGRFMIKEFEQTGQSLLTVALDTDGDFGKGKETTLEYSIKIAASLARMCADSGRSIDILAGGTFLRNAGWQSAMDYLATLQKDVENNRNELPGFPKQSKEMIAILPAVESRLTAVLSHLASQGQRFEVILLENFAPEEEAERVLSKLKISSSDVVRCSPGELAATIKSLSTYFLLTGKTDSRVA